MVKTAGCLDHWNKAPRQGEKRVLAALAVRNPQMVHSGMVFVIDHGGDLGHTGLIERVEGGLITTSKAIPTPAGPVKVVEFIA